MLEYKFLINQFLYNNVKVGLFIVLAVTILTIIAASVFSAIEIKKQKGDTDAGKAALLHGGMPDSDNTD